MNSYQKPGLLNSIPPVTRNIIIINVIAWLATLALTRINIDLVRMFGLYYFQAPGFKIYQLVTYMFLHGSWGHIFFNMFAVYMFGQVIENSWNTKRFLTFYLITGIGAGLMQEFVWFLNMHDLSNYQFITDGQTKIPVEEYLNQFITIGASGAVFGILIAFGMMFPNIPLMLIFLPIPIKAKYFVVLYGVVELFLGIGNFGGDKIAHFAHLGGMLFGLIMILYWKRKDKTFLFNKLMNRFFNLFKKPMRKMKVTYGSGNSPGYARKSDYDYNAGKNQEIAEIDRILEKIKKSGYNCLTEEEKKKLFDASNK